MSSFSPPLVESPDGTFADISRNGQESVVPISAEQFRRLGPFPCVKVADKERRKALGVIFLRPLKDDRSGIGVGFLSQRHVTNHQEETQAGSVFLEYGAASSTGVLSLVPPFALHIRSRRQPEMVALKHRETILAIDDSLRLRTGSPFLVVRAEYEPLLSTNPDSWRPTSRPACNLCKRTEPWRRTER